jgi:hypothetical protein
MPAGPDCRELVHLLSAAAGPARPDELAGEDAVLAAFVAAGAGPAAVVPQPRVRRRAITRAITVKVAAGVAVLSLSGVAFAAETGRLPHAAQQTAHELFSSWGVPAPSPSSARPDGTPGSGGDPGRPGAPSTGAPGTGTTPQEEEPAVRGQCRAFVESQRGGHGKSLDKAVRDALAKAAGGEANIESYCAKLLGEQPASTPGPVPDPAPDNPAGGGGPGNGNGGGNGHGKTEKPHPTHK